MYFNTCAKDAMNRRNILKILFVIHEHMKGGLSNAAQGFSLTC